MSPIAKFVFTVSGLTFNGIDKSDNVPTSWLWDFGDLSNSIDQNPTHIYALSGNYTVTLTVTNLDGSETISQQIVIYPTGVFIIDTIILEDFPEGFTLSQPFIDQRKKYWRLYLQTLIEPKIPDPHLDDENYWPPLVNMLIAKLIEYDYLLKLANEAMISAMGSGGNSGGSSTTTGSGNLKSMEMGPSKAEWYDSATTIKSFFGSSGVDGQSMFDSISSQVCQLAKRLRIYLPMCGLLSKNPNTPQKVKSPKKPTSIQYLQHKADNYPTKG